MAADRIARAWVGFQHATLPVDMPPAQREAMRLAFYAGAVELCELVTHELSDPDEPTEADEAMTRDLAEEVAVFISKQAREARAAHSV